MDHKLPYPAPRLSILSGRHPLMWACTREGFALRLCFALQTERKVPGPRAERIFTKIFTSPNNTWDVESMKAELTEAWAATALQLALDELKAWEAQGAALDELTRVTEELGLYEDELGRRED